MLIRSGKNWAFDLFQRRGWLIQRRRLRQRDGSGSRPAIVAADCQSLEERILLSTITVTSLADNLTVDGNVTLREALQAANTHASVDGSVAGQAGVQNVITFQPGLTGTIALNVALGQMTISSSVVINGLGAANTTINGQLNSRIFDITGSAGNVTLDGLTLTNGKTTASGASGGAIRSFSAGTLTLSNSILSGNSTTGQSAGGGAVYASGVLTVTNCTVSGNSTAGNYASGGAIETASGLTVTNSTISGNSTNALLANGGAIAQIANQGIVTFLGSTFSGNSTTGTASYGGAVFALTPVVVTNSTLTGNSTTASSTTGGAIWGYGVTATNSTIALNHAAGNAGGLYDFGSSILRNSILAQNTDSGIAPDLQHQTGRTVTTTHSLIGDNKGSGLTAAPVGSPDANGNLIGTHAAPIDPKLGALGNNGGLLKTLALLVGSPAIGAGSNAKATDPGADGIAGTGDDITLVNDERGAGFARITGTVDMGAYEIEPLAAPTVNFTVTNNPLPVATGTYDQLNTKVLQVIVNGTTFTLGTNSQLASDGSGHWTLTTTATIPDGTYDMVVHNTDPSGNVSTDATTIDLIVDTSALASTLFTGEYAVATPGSNVLSLASITQNGTQLALNGTVLAAATVTTTTQLQIGGVVATYGDSKITFGSTGTFANQVWTKLDLPTDYTNPAGSQVHIVQNGTGLTFSDRNGTQSAGTWISPTQIHAYNETVTVGSGQSTGQLLWADGTIWSEVVNIAGTNHGSGTTLIQAVPSKMLVTDYLTGSGFTVHTVQTGTTNIVFIDRLGNMVLGTYTPYDPNTNTPQATAPNYAGYAASIVGNTITWTDGNPAHTVVWTKTSSPASTITVTDYTNQNGVPVHLIQNGTNAFVIVDGLGNTSLGHFLSGTTGVADSYPTDVATFTGNQVIWSDGIFVWTTTNNPPLLITLTDTNNAIAHIQLLTPTTLVGLDGSLNAIKGTRLNGKIFWSNGQVWDNLNFNALNAFFEIGTGYP